MGAAVALAASADADRVCPRARWRHLPDWRGQWVRVDGGHGPQFDPSKPPGRGQQVPLNAEYQAIFEANLKSLATGTQPYIRSWAACPGMPAP